MGFGPAPWCDTDGSYFNDREETMFRILRDAEDRIRAEECAAAGHPFAWAFQRCEDQIGHALDEPCNCGKCRCGAQSYDSEGNPVRA